MNNKERSSFSIVVSVFFFWGFVAAANGVLTPAFKTAFSLSNWQSQMVSFCFYGAYFIGSLLYMLISKWKNNDLLNLLGYQRSISLGLFVSALGSLLVIPAATYNSFYLMISGLFIIGLGFSLQQTAANPFVIRLGSSKSSSQRLSLAGGVNNIGSTIAPILITIALFGSLNPSSNVKIQINDLQTPYLILGAAFIIASIVFFFSGKEEYQNLAMNRKLKSEVADTKVERFNPFKHKQLYLGMLAIFFYVGVEVATDANLGEYMKSVLGYSDSDTGPFISLYWASLMIGRWASASSAFNLGDKYNSLLKIILPYAAFLLFMGVSFVFGKDVSMFWSYALIIPVMIIADFISKDNPAKQLAIFSTLGIVSLLVGMFTSGIVSLFAFISVGLFCSTLWPCIFTLSISGLGKNVAKGSSMLIMMILGGGVITLIQGALMDVEAIGISYSFFMGVLCFAYLIYFAFKAGPIHQRNLDLELNKSVD